MKRAFHYLGLFARCFWPPIYQSRVPHLLLAALTGVGLYYLSLPSKRGMLRSHLGITNAAEFVKVEAEHHRFSPFEFDAGIYLRGTPQQIRELLESQGFEERAVGLFDWETHDFPAGPPLPPPKQVRFFHRKIPGNLHELILTDLGFTQLWMKAAKI